MCKQLIIKKDCNKIIEYYITDFERKNRVYLDRISRINENAFFNAKIESSVELFMNESLCIGAHAFENSSLNDFICVNGQERFTENKHTYDFYTHEKIEIQYHAFKDCENLHTIVIPEFNSLSIEKGAFENCKNIRSVVLVESDDTSSVSISDEAFSNYTDITFICKKDGKVARYAREHSFRIVSLDD